MFQSLYVLTLSDHLSTPQANATKSGRNPDLAQSMAFRRVEAVSDGQDGSSFDGIAKPYTSYHVLRLSYVGGWPSW